MLPSGAALSTSWCAGSASSSSAYRINRHEFPGKRLCYRPTCRRFDGENENFRTRGQYDSQSKCLRNAVRCATLRSRCLTRAEERPPYAADNTCPASSAGMVPAAVLPPNLLTLLKDTVKSPSVLQIPQQAGGAEPDNLDLYRRRQYRYCSSFWMRQARSGGLSAECADITGWGDGARKSSCEGIGFVPCLSTPTG